MFFWWLLRSEYTLDFRRLHTMLLCQSGSMIYSKKISGSVNLCLTVVPWVINIGALVMALLRHRKYIALGILAVYGVLFALAIIASILFVVGCFILAAQVGM